MSELAAPAKNESTIDESGQNSTTTEAAAADEAQRDAGGRETAAVLDATLHRVAAAPEPPPAEAGTRDGRQVTKADPQDLARWNEQVRRRMRQHTRRSFLAGGAAALAGVAGWWWLTSRPERDGIAWPLRRALGLDEKVGRGYFSSHRLAPDLRGKAALGDRVNGDLGLDDPVDLASWRLKVEGLAGAAARVALTLDAIRRLPRVEMTAELKCIEGWSVVVQWAGALFSDFMAAYPPATPSGRPLDLRRRPEDAPPYVGMETPDGGYYVGVDIESMLHPQTLLAYEMNGAPLAQEHGFPLRLVTPVKYGVKNIKRIGTIRYGRKRPTDYWAEQGYDWYLGL